MNWLEKLHAEDRAVIFVSLAHTRHDMDISLPAALLERSQVMFNDLDLAVNTRSKTNFAEGMPDLETQAIWASFWACFRDVHQPQYNLNEEAWAFLERMMELLNDDSEVAICLAQKPICNG